LPTNGTAASAADSEHLLARQQVHELLPLARAMNASDVQLATQTERSEATCVCDPGFIKTGVEWIEGEDLCIVPETLAAFLTGFLFALSVLILLVLVPSTVYSMNAKLKTKSNRAKILRGLIARLCLVLFAGGNAVWSSVLFFAILDSKMVAEHEARKVARLVSWMYCICFIFISIVLVIQLEKYYRFTFKGKTPPFMFLALKILHSLILFGCALAVAAYGSSHEILLYSTQVALVETSLFFFLFCVLFQRCFLAIKMDIRKAAGKSKSKVQNQKLRSSIKQISKLQVATFAPAAVCIVCGRCCGTSPVFLRVHVFVSSTLSIIILLSIGAMQLDYFRRAYIKKLKKIARTLKELERRGMRLDSKWAKIKAYATQSSVAPVSAASSSLQHSQPILSDS
jgi:hypothetical protein